MVLLCQVNNFDATIFALIEEMKKNPNFISHYQRGGRLPIEDKSMKKNLFRWKLLPVPKTRFAEINYSRVWQTNVYDGVFFNDYFKVNLEGVILKRVIINGVTGRNWRFKRFDRLCITVHSDQYRGVGN